MAISEALTLKGFNLTLLSDYILVSDFPLSLITTVVVIYFFAGLTKVIHLMPREN